MAEVCMIRVDWDRTAIPLPQLPQFHTVRVAPEPGWPLGRKGLALAGAWRQMSRPQTDGLIILDGDVAVDPVDLAAMSAAVHHAPDVVHVAPVRLWTAPGTTDWVWAHWRAEQGQEPEPDPDRFSFGFTYLPRRLIEACIKAGLEEWTFPHVDELVAATAASIGVPARVVAGCHPKHLHF
jgi:hypothetical protein